MLKQIVSHWWFFLVELFCLVIGILLWSNFPKITWQPFLIACVPLILRIFAGKHVFVRTPFDIPIVFFLITAGVGIWSAYQPIAAWTKFGYILISILFYYIISRQPIENLRRTAGLLSMMGFGVCIYFLLSNNWALQQQKYYQISKIGIAWMNIRPNLPLIPIHPNDVAGLVILTLPFALGLTYHFWKMKSYFWGTVFAVMVSLSIISIILSSSRGAWVAIAGTGGFWLIWFLIGRFSEITKISQKLSLITLFGILICITVIYFWYSFHETISEIYLGKEDALVAEQRMHLFGSTIELIKDFPFTGGGLDSFPGLYSRYIIMNPNYILPYSHNLYLDTLLNQGILGGIMLIWIFSGSIYLLLFSNVPKDYSILRNAILSSMLLITCHGLFDNILYSTTSTVLLFFIPGMVIGLNSSTNFKVKIQHLERIEIHKLALPILITACLVILGLLIKSMSLISAWYTNLGVVEMAKVELHDFPTGKWDEGRDVDLFTPAEALFNHALSYNPGNPQAHFRLGLIDMLKREFPNAVNHLEIAYQGDPYHRGIIKALGLSYIWNGQIEDAIPLLTLLPESNQELSTYSWWWNQQGRPDLSSNAEKYLLWVGSDQ